MNIAKRQFELLKKIGFVRTSASEEELRAVNILKEELDNLGVESEIEPFKVLNYNIKKAKLEILEPEYREIEVTGVGLTGNAAKDGLEAELLYVENALPINLLEAKGKIVLVNSINYERYRDIVRSGAVGYINFSGRFMDDNNSTDLENRRIREKHIEFGKIPGVTMRVSDAIELMKSGAKKVRMTLEQEEGEADSHNLIAELKGTQFPEEVVVIMAHYDSVPFSTGVYDNGAGSVNIMEILRYYKENPPKRTIRFIWFGSEEIGLCGSKAYVKAHENELENVKMGINVDVGGAILGCDQATVLAEESLCHMVDFYAKQVCFPLKVDKDIYSSDCIPFADKGIPVINFMRFGAPGAASIHNRYDLIDVLSPEVLYNTMVFVRDFSEKLINAGAMPVERKIPEDLVKKIDEYLQKNLK
ncbi:Zn-dependent amino-or carboxypeptidase, M28 family [Hathewaya proteolytica DSM 3090]|uniref:Carboxypeptidase Q n=1 Tax=Hathewaya proteolytica DSM 3090 TaxID=1121331 RepID=A0A1M6NW08_9CLOT|nr:M28 family peptidase [Hathewaya proteolytica]SHJ99875.1 Zn-dependent amino-or carboxypeptidase, M28 family [Hathewaya proteolytica DSM 3090]